MKSFLAPVARALSDAVLPLRTGFSDLEEAEAFFARFGWDVALSSGSNLADIRAAFAFGAALDPLLQHLDEFINGTDRDEVSVTLDLLKAAKDAVDAIGAFGAVSSLPPPLNSGAFWSDIAQELVDDLTASYLEDKQPLLFAALHVGAIILYDRVPQFGPAALGRIAYQRTTIRWNKLGELLTNPGQLLGDHYGWGVGLTFDHKRLFRAIERSMLAFKLHPSVQPPRPGLVSQVDTSQIVAQTLYELDVPIIDGFNPSDDAWWKIGLVLLPVSDPITQQTGVFVRPVLQAGASLDFPLGSDIALKISGDANAGSVLTAKIFPNGASVTFDPSAATVALDAEISGTPAEPYILFGAADSHRIELDGFTAAVGTRGLVGDPEIYFRAGTGPNSKLRLVVDFGAGESDGFIDKLLSSQQKLELEIEGALTWSSKHGLSVEGAAGVDFVKYIHRALGPVLIETLHVKAGAGTGGLHLDFGVGLKGTFGPVDVVVEDIGLRMTLTSASGGSAGAFGNLDIDFGFKPPSGVGLSIDAGVIKGGGYLYFDADKEQYAGALEFELAGSIRLTAVGLLTTRMPDGTKGFSLLIILTAEFGTGIQIGMGFTLLGVGGLLGLNRTMVLQELVDGVRSGAVNSIMFPTDVVANAPRIISDLQAMFPPKQDVFLVGPMAKLAWGSPALVTLSLGVIIEIPGDIAIVGVLKLALPNPDDPILVLQVNFVGAIEFENSRLYLFAALFDSHVLSMTIDGELGVLAVYGNTPNFLLSVGGFNPRFVIPPLPFPTPARVSINILNQSNARIRVMSYFALTSNTAQLGAHADLYFSFSRCSIEGYIGFDALFQFSPFHFVIDAGASLGARVFGKGLFSVSVQMSLEGPAPWHVTGSGTLSFRFFDVDFDFARTWGESHSQSLQDVSALPLLESQFALEENWRAIWPENANLLVSLRKPDTQAQTLILHPIGKLRISQKKVPLALGIGRIGTDRVTDIDRATLAVTSTGFEKTGDAVEKFAMAQFIAMDDATKLSRPGFEDGFGGIELGIAGADLAASQAVVRTVRFDELILDTAYKTFWRRRMKLSAILFNHFARDGAVANSPLSAANAKSGYGFVGNISVKASGWAVTYQNNNTPVSAEAAYFISETMAHDYLQQQQANTNAPYQAMQVVGAHEVAQ